MQTREIAIGGTVQELSQESGWGSVSLAHWVASPCLPAPQPGCSMVPTTSFAHISLTFLTYFPLPCPSLRYLSREATYTLILVSGLVLVKPKN